MGFFWNAMERYRRGVCVGKTCLRTEGSMDLRQTIGREIGHQVMQEKERAACQVHPSTSSLCEQGLTLNLSECPPSVCDVGFKEWL